MSKLDPCPFRGCKVFVEIERPGWPTADVNLYVIQDLICGFRMVSHDRGKLEETWNSKSGEFLHLQSRNEAMNQLVAGLANWMRDTRTVLAKTHEMITAADAMLASQGKAPSRFSSLLGQAIRNQIEVADRFLSDLEEQCRISEGKSDDANPR